MEAAQAVTVRDDVVQNRLQVVQVEDWLFVIPFDLVHPDEYLKRGHRRESIGCNDQGEVQ